MLNYRQHELRRGGRILPNHYHTLGVPPFNVVPVRLQHHLPAVRQTRAAKHVDTGACAAARAYCCTVPVCDSQPTCCLAGGAACVGGLSQWAFSWPTDDEDVFPAFPAALLVTPGVLLFCWWILLYVVDLLL